MESLPNYDGWKLGYPRDWDEDPEDEPEDEGETMQKDPSRARHPGHCPGCKAWGEPVDDHGYPCGCCVDGGFGPSEFEPPEGWAEHRRRAKEAEDIAAAKRTLKRYGRWVDYEAALKAADEMAAAFEPIVCNLDPVDSGCDDPCHVCSLAQAHKARKAYLELRGTEVSHEQSSSAKSA